MWEEWGQFWVCFFFVQKVYCGLFCCVTGLCFISFGILAFHERAGEVVLNCKSLFWNSLKSASFAEELCLPAKDSFV